MVWPAARCLDAESLLLLCAISTEGVESAVDLVKKALDAAQNGQLPVEGDALAAQAKEQLGELGGELAQVLGARLSELGSLLGGEAQKVLTPYQVLPHNCRETCWLSGVLGHPALLTPYTGTPRLSAAPHR